MEKPKNIRNGLAVAGLGFTAAMLFAGCTSQGGEEVPVPEVTEQITVGKNNDAPLISTEYYPNGTRRVYVSFWGYDSANVIGYCEGGDLVEVALTYRGVGQERQIGHAACADNRLTQQDFPPLPQ